MEEDIPIEHTWVTRAIERAQKRVEQRHFEIRKNLLKFDDVMNTQRQTIYDLRDSILEGEDLKGVIWEMVENGIDDHLENALSGTEEEEGAGVEGFVAWLNHTFTLDTANWPVAPDKLSREELREQTLKSLKELYEKREAEMGAETMQLLERLVLLDRIDSHWKEHLYNIDYIEEGIHLRGYAGKDPIVVFKNEAFGIFEAMYQRIEEEVSEYMFKARVDTEAPRRATPRRRVAAAPHRTAPQPFGDDVSASQAATFASRQAAGELPRVGRNDPCPCGSGKKYKKCHGK
jgi:preprotein translocase subunit SecA